MNDLDSSMSKRIGLTVPDTIYAKLEKWADYEGRPLANLCNFLIERAVRESEKAGDEWTKADDDGDTKGNRHE